MELFLFTWLLKVPIFFFFNCNLFARWFLPDFLFRVYYLADKLPNKYRFCNLSGLANNSYNSVPWKKLKRIASGRLVVKRIRFRFPSHPAYTEYIWGESSFLWVGVVKKTWKEKPITWKICKVSEVYVGTEKKRGGSRKYTLHLYFLEIGNFYFCFVTN